MNVLVIGAGGREHALVSKLHQSPLIEKLYAIPGNDAMTHLAEVHTEIAETDHEAILQFVQQHHIEWVIIGPEQPLIDGLSNKLRDNHVKVLVLTKKQPKLKVLNLLLKG